MAAAVRTAGAAPDSASRRLRSRREGRTSGCCFSSRSTGAQQVEVGDHGLPRAQQGPARGCQMEGQQQAETHRACEAAAADQPVPDLVAVEIAAAPDQQPSERHSGQHTQVHQGLDCPQQPVGIAGSRLGRGRHAAQEGPVEREGRVSEDLAAAGLVAVQVGVGISHGLALGAGVVPGRWRPEECRLRRSFRKPGPPALPPRRRRG